MEKTPLAPKKLTLTRETTRILVRTGLRAGGDTLNQAHVQGDTLAAAGR